MSVSTDSIQTLLKQRRELRGYLQELRDEISALNVRADKYVTTSEGETTKDSPTPIEASDITIPEKLDTTRGEGETVKPNERPSTADTPGEGERELGMQPMPSAPVLIAETAPEVSKPKVQAADLPPEASIMAAEKPTSATSDPNLVSIEEISNVDDENLLYQAKLLSEYFLNHPAPASSEDLARLDESIKRCEVANTAKLLEKEFPELRAAYRIVAAKSYEETGVNGETLVDSGSNITLLWIVPLYITALTLVLFPLLLLSRSVANRMFVADFSEELTFVMTCIAAFLWGAVGALSYLTWGIARNAKNNLYRIGSVRDVGLRATLGGILGIVVFLCLVGWISTESVIPDMIIGITSFFTGLASSVVFAYLHRMIEKFTRKVEKKSGSLK